MDLVHRRAHLLSGGTSVDLVRAASAAAVRGGTERIPSDHKRCSIKVLTKCNALCYNVFYLSTHTHTHTHTLKLRSTNQCFLKVQSFQGVKSETVGGSVVSFFFFLCTVDKSFIRLQSVVSLKLR